MLGVRIGQLTGEDLYLIRPAALSAAPPNESFGGVFCDGCLNRWLFASVQEVRRIITNWLEEYKARE